MHQSKTKNDFNFIIANVFDLHKNNTVVLS